MTRQPRKPLAERILDADIQSGRHLGDANAAAEAGDHAKAELHYRKSQFWLDRYNRLAGNS